MITLETLVSLIKKHPLIASVQADDHSVLNETSILRKMAEESLAADVRVLRLGGGENVATIKSATGAPVIGLVKRRYSDSPVYITPTRREVEELLESGCEVIALDGTNRVRPKGEKLTDLLRLVHQNGRLALADIDEIDNARLCALMGFDMLSTTLAGYTEESVMTVGPDLDLLASVARLGKPTLGEGRYSEPWQVQVALRMGAIGVVIGGSLNDPGKQTRMFTSAVKSAEGLVGAVDLGGTWLRFGVFDEDWKLLESSRIETPAGRQERLDWIRDRVLATGVSRVGVSSGGVIDPRHGVVIESKPTIPNHVTTAFRQETLGVPTLALNDGHATAWGHACLPQFAGLRVATLALGTGVGCGLVDRHRIVMGPLGAYPRLNDLSPFPGNTYEDLLGGATLTAEPSEASKDRAKLAAVSALRMLRALYMPNAIVLAGSVGLSDWLDLRTVAADGEADRVLTQIVPSPFGTDAGLYGAAALALYPPNLS